MTDSCDSHPARGASRLAFDAIEQLTNVVERMHANIAAGSPPVGRGTAGRTRGITGVVYESIRMVNGGSRAALDLALARLEPREGPPSARAGAICSAVNGVLGDYLARTDNPLAIEMRVRRGGVALRLEREALAAAIPDAGGRVLLLVHGLCMNDRLWRRGGHDHGAALAAELGLTPVYLHYNSGLHVSENGRGLAALLQELVDAWPVEVTELDVLAHSMGGLVTRSACHYARQARHGWLGLLRRMAFLGTPHHGAPLERGGNLLETVLGVSPYTAPLTRLGWLRSAGITDLRHGNLLDEDWQGRDRFQCVSDPRRPVLLPDQVDCYAVAATRGRSSGDLKDRLLGDGLVPVASALGHHSDEAMRLGIPPWRQAICPETSHLDLLGAGPAYERIREWFA